MDGVRTEPLKFAPNLRHSLPTADGNEMPKGYSVSDLHTLRVHITEYDRNK